jgi:hypothetical protein
MPATAYPIFNKYQIGYPMFCRDQFFWPPFCGARAPARFTKIDVFLRPRYVALSLLFCRRSLVCVVARQEFMAVKKGFQSKILGSFHK